MNRQVKDDEETWILTASPVAQTDDSNDAITSSTKTDYGTFDDKKTDLEEAIDLTGVGKFHVSLMIICGTCLTTMITESMGVSFVLPAAQCDLALSTADKGYLSGATFLGMILSAHAWGFSADTLGRKKILLTALWGTWLSSILSSFSPNVWSFIALRFITGLFLSGMSSTVYAYLSEFLPAKSRSKFMTWTCGFIAVGFLLIPSAAWLILPRNINWNIGFMVFKSWRLFIVIMGILSFVNGFMILRYPESPKFLMSIGKTEKALNVLREMFASNSGKNPAEYPVEELRYEVPMAEEKPGILSEDLSVHRSKSATLAREFIVVVWRQTYPLFLSPHGWKTLLFCTLQFGIYVSSGGMYLWLPTILNLMTIGDPSHTKEIGATVCELLPRRGSTTHQSNANFSTAMECVDDIPTETYVSSLIVGGSFVVSYATIGALLIVVDNRKILVSAQLMSGIAGIGTYFARSSLLVTVFMAGYIVLAGTCVSVLSAVVVDVYPTNLRAMAVALALTCGRLGSGLAGNVIGILMEANCDATLIGMGCVTLCCGLLCILIPKTKPYSRLE